MMKRFLPVILLLLSMRSLQAQVRTVEAFNNDWNFFLGNDSAASALSFGDADWQSLNLPHDWSIALPFDQKAPATTQGGALPGGIGWYRKLFTLDGGDKTKRIFIEFEGVQQKSEVWINGHHLGKRPNGYVTFRYELTPFLKFDGSKNVIAVKADNSQQPNSRWYTGSGIYRDVWFIKTNQVAIGQWGSFVSTPFITTTEARINIETRLDSSQALIGPCFIYTDIYDAAGQLIHKETRNLAARNLLKPGYNKHVVNITISKPTRWSIDDPHLYKAVTTVVSGGKITDQTSTRFGIRSIYFDREKGFFLNDQSLKIKGVCMHHDLGALGAAFNKAAAKRQLKILKEMGCNAIRTSHNPSAPAFLDLCDEMGFLVMVEAFDMWQKKKNKFDYFLDFKEWHARDIADMVLRDRNHPSVFMWSIGNEIREQFDSTGTSITNDLVSIIKNIDTTRPVTSALTEMDTLKNYIYQAKALDVLGWNYNHLMYPEFLKRYPGQKFIASETNSAIATRGHYDLPADSLRIWPAKGQKVFDNGNPDFTVSAYDNAIAYWGGTHEDTWKTIKKYDFLSGLFVWTGFDYLGEPTPYPWPARSSYFGIVDLAGFPKDVYYMYQSEWTKKNVLHLMPHWNWKAGETIDVKAYFNNADEVELFLNGRSLGTRRKKGDALHVLWQVKFAPGILKAVSRRNGKTVLTTERRTAGKPYRLRLTADRTTINANGKDISFITVEVLDENGTLVPDAADLINFEVQGSGFIAGVDNGLQTSLESFKANHRKAFNGLCLAMVQSKNTKGNIVFKATAKGLQPAQLVLSAR